MRIAVHDYAGHPFEFELTRELAARGHEARHFYFAGDYGPKGSATRRDGDPESYSVAPLTTSKPYDKKKLFRRWELDREYGQTAAREIANFKPDIVISGNAPLDAQARILKASQRSNAAFIFWMQDMISPLAHQQLGGRWGGLGTAIANHYAKLEKKLVLQSDGVVLISADFADELQRLGARPDVLSVIPNWGALKDIDVRPKQNAWAKRMGIEGKTVLLYSGTLGVKHSPLMLVDLADAFADRADVLILVAAVGAGLDRLKEELALRPRANIRIEQLQPLEDFADMLGSATALIALLEQDAGRFCVPSKILSYLCAGRPILLAAPPQNLGSSVLTDAGAGRNVPAGDGAALAAAAMQILSDPEGCEKAGANGRAYAEHTFDIVKIVDRFEEVMDAAAAKKGRAFIRPAAVKTSKSLAGAFYSTANSL